MIDFSNITLSDEKQVLYLPAPEAHYIALKLDEAGIDFSLFAWNEPRVGSPALSVEKAREALSPFTERGAHVIAPYAIETRVSKEELLKAALSLTVEPLDADYRLYLSGHARLLPGMMNLDGKTPETIAPIFRGCSEYLPQHEAFVQKLEECARDSSLSKTVMAACEESGHPRPHRDALEYEPGTCPEIRVVERRGLVPCKTNLLERDDVLQAGLLGFAYEISAWLAREGGPSRAELFFPLHGEPFKAIIQDERTHGIREIETHGVRMELWRDDNASLGFRVHGIEPDFLSPDVKPTGRDLCGERPYPAGCLTIEEAVYSECLLKPSLPTKLELKRHCYGARVCDDYLVFEVPCANPLIERRIYLNGMAGVALVEGKRGLFREFRYHKNVSAFFDEFLGLEGASETSTGPSPDLFSKTLLVNDTDQSMRKALSRECPDVWEFALEAYARIRQLYSEHEERLAGGTRADQAVIETAAAYVKGNTRSGYSIVRVRSACSYLIDHHRAPREAVPREALIAALQLSSHEADLFLFEDLGVNARWALKLEAAGYATVSDLAGATIVELLDIDGIGSIAIKEIKDGLRRFGLEHVLRQGDL